MRDGHEAPDRRESSESQFDTLDQKLKDPETATDPKFAALRRRKKMGYMFWLGFSGFIVAAGAAVGKWAIWGAAIDPSFVGILMVCGSLMAAATGIYVWQGKGYGRRLR